jgi:hypothetical protein
LPHREDPALAEHLRRLAADEARRLGGAQPFGVRGLA